MEWLKPEFILFFLTLTGVVLLHKHSLAISLVGMAAIAAYKTFLTDFSWLHHFHHESSGLLNLIGLLLGFSLLAKYFEESHFSGLLPFWFPRGWMGGVVLLGMVMIISSFLDNIAAALIGGSIASSVFRKRVHVGFLAAIAAASNAGGAGSVVGDTTTTMMWIDGVSAPSMLHAFIGSLAAFAFFGVIGAWQQHRHEPMHDARESVPKVDWARLAIVLGILLGAVASNLAFDFPAAGVWAAILIGGVFRKPDWGEVRAAVKGSVFLVALVFAASLLPVASLPPASWGSALVLGVVSAFFGSLPLTKLALEQGGYDWGFLAFAVGFGGSMIWFGSAAGVALAGRFPEAKSARNWVWKGWHVPVGYVAGCLAILALSGWQPLIHKPARGPVPSPADSPPAGHHRNGTSGQNVAEAP